MEKKKIEMTLGEIVSVAQTLAELGSIKGLKPLYKYKIASFSIPFTERANRIIEARNQVVRDSLKDDEMELSDPKVLAKVSKQNTEMLLTKEEVEYCGDIELSWLGDNVDSINLFPIVKFIKES